MTSRLFSPLEVRGVRFENRAWLSAMCQYSAEEGLPNTWHLTHLSKFAVGGTGLVMTEATAVEPIGRISPGDTGIWNDSQADRWREIADFIHGQGTVVGVQLAHAGRKAATALPWEGMGYVGPENGGWVTVGPSQVAFGSLPAPRALTLEEVAEIPRLFAEAARRSDGAGFDVVELHAAHGYLLHQFLSPLANVRDDRYGGSFEGRVRLTLETAEAVRAVWPDSKPLFVRISATDWMPGGWDIDQSVELATLLGERGVDLIDCSSGGLVHDARIAVSPGYQVPFAERIREGAGILTGAVGMITEAAQAEEIIATGKADAVFLGKEMLRQPHWPLQAARQLGEPVSWPQQYLPAAPRDR